MYSSLDRPRPWRTHEMPTTRADLFISIHITGNITITKELKAQRTWFSKSDLQSHKTARELVITTVTSKTKICRFLELCQSYITMLNSYKISLQQGAHAYASLFKKKQFHAKHARGKTSGVHQASSCLLAEMPCRAFLIKQVYLCA